MKRQIPNLVVVGVLLLPVTALSGQPDPAERPGPKPTPKKAAKPVFPKLSGGQKSLAARRLKQLANRNPEKSKAAEIKLIAMGSGILPQVLGRLSDNIPARTANLERVALKVMRRQDAPAAALYLANHQKSVRTLIAHLLLKAANPAVLPAVVGAFKKEKTPPVREAMAFCLCHLGSTKGLPTLYRLTLSDFMANRDRILAASKRIKGPQAARWLDAKMTSKSSTEKLAALRLLAMAGDRTSAKIIAPLLDAKNHKLATETINTLRAIMDGKPPLKHISVFNMIGLRERWKGRVAGL